MSDGFPIGAIIAFPGNSDPPSSSHWALCDGSPQSITGPFAPLFGVIGFANGGTQASGNFYLPDYRGRFLRGTAYGTKNDPDSQSRTALKPGGNTGDNVGSVQGFDTAPPVHRPFELRLHLPTSSLSNAATAVGPTASNWNGGTVKVPFQGGDAETRPINAYVLYYIKYTNA